MRRVGNAHGECNGVFLDDGTYGFHIEDKIIYNVATPLRFNRTMQDKCSWGQNYFGSRSEQIQYTDNSGVSELGRKPMLSEEALLTLRQVAGPVPKYRRLWEQEVVQGDER